MRGRLEPKDTVERFWGLKFIGFPNLSDETPKPNPSRCVPGSAPTRPGQTREIEADERAPF